MVNKARVQKNEARLSEAFEALRAQNILARMNFRCCQSCGGAELGDLTEKKNAAGFVFYHKQDADDLARCGSVLLAYTGGLDCAKPPSNSKSTLQIGQAVVAELTRHGLAHEWNGKDSERITVLLDMEETPLTSR